MKDKINIENYEAFYLDYLEGNLNDDLTLALFAFLAENPEMQVEDLGPELSDTSFVLDNVFKNNLKQNQISVAISSANIEYFLTAEKENQLSEEKINELNLFVASHPAYKLDRKIYSLSSISADESIVFTSKKALKRKESIVLWPYLSLLAAACAVLIVWLIPNSAYDGDIQSAASVPNVQRKANVSNTNSDTKAPVINVALQPLTKYSNKDIVKNTLNVAVAQRNKAITGTLSRAELKGFETISLSDLSYSTLPERQPNAIAYQPSSTLDEATTSTLAMKNPVKPITNKLSDVIKTQVDYKTGLDIENKRKGFYLKIGQFEIYQNKKVK